MAGTMTGRLLNNRYQVGERIGVGGMAEVYQGQDNVLGRTVAIKVMLPQYAEDPSFTARFRQEAASAANLQSPYIVNIYDWGQDADTSFIIMEYVRGSDLKTAINQRGAVNQRKVAEIGSQVCQALAVAHNLDIVHRDIKPQNIMVQPDGNVKVMDFGIARAKNSVMEKTSAVLGTAHYISPEQAQGKDLTAASDIYSLGVVLYEAATGQLPFDGPDAVSVALKQVSEEPLPPREVNPNIDPNLEAIIMKAMSKNPFDRFATARDMRHALNDFLAGRAVNISGFSGEQTAFMAEPAPEIVGSRYPTDQTAILNNPAVIDPVLPSEPISGRIAPVKATTHHGKGRGVIIALCLLVAIAAIAGLSYVLLGNGIQISQGIELPDVTGKTLNEATTELMDAGFTVAEPEYIFSDTIEKDLVASQTPRAGTTQEQGTEVKLTVSQGVEQVAVPDLTDLNANEARAELQRVGLDYESGTAEYSETVKENRVARQSPAAGETVAKGSVVTYYLSLGVETVSIPNIVGEDEETAIALLKEAGFKVKTTYEPSNYYYQGAVIRQSPTSNQKAKNGATINIVVSNGPSYFEVAASVNDSDGGSVSPEYVTASEGDSVSFSITPNDGYVIADVSDSNGNEYGKADSVTIKDIEGDVYLSVTFEKDPDSPDTPDSSKSAKSSDTDESEDETADTEETADASADAESTN